MFAAEIRPTETANTSSAASGLGDRSGHDFIDEKMLVEMAYNDGSGPANQKVCDKMATRFEQWMEQHTNEVRDFMMQPTSLGEAAYWVK